MARKFSDFKDIQPWPLNYYIAMDGKESVFPVSEVVQLLEAYGNARYVGVQATRCFEKAVENKDSKRMRRYVKLMEKAAIKTNEIGFQINTWKNRT